MRLKSALHNGAVSTALKARGLLFAASDLALLDTSSSIQTGWQLARLGELGRAPARPSKIMLRTSPYSTTGPAYGLLAQLFGSTTKTAYAHAGQIATLLDFAALDLKSRADLTGFVQGVEGAPPVVTVFRLNDPRGGLGDLKFVSPYAPLFDAAV